MSTTTAVPQIVHLDGDIDVAAVLDVKTRLQDAAGATDTVVADMRDVEFIDSTGLGALISVHGRLQRQGGQLIVVANQQSIVELFSITGLDSVFTIQPDLPDGAVAAAT